MRSLSGTPSEVIIARGDDFADALAAAPYAYARTSPILLVKPDSLPSDTRALLNEFSTAGVDDALIAGGSGAVGAGVESDIRSLGYTTSRAQGKDRYATAAALVTYAVDHDWATPSVVGVTTGEDFPDALGGGAAIGAQGGAIVLTRATALRSDAANVLENCTGDLSDVRVLGGTSAVSSVVLNDIKRIWNLP